MRHQRIAAAGLAALVLALGACTDEDPVDEVKPDVAVDSAQADSGVLDAGPADVPVLDTAGPQDTSKPKPPLTWNVMVYMASDNNLERSGIDDIKEMRALPGSDDVRFHVQTDRASGFYQLGLGELDAWENTKRLIIKGGKGEVDKSLDEELNTADPAELSKFIKWAAQTYPADRNILVLWNHGMGWQGFGGDEHSKQKMDLPGIVKGVKDGMAAAKLDSFDLLGFDACLMGDYAVADRMRAFAPWLILSQDLEPSHGWNYGAFAAAIKDTHIGVKALGKELVSAYQAQAKAQKRAQQ